MTTLTSDEEGCCDVEFYSMSIVPLVERDEVGRDSDTCRFRKAWIR